MPWSRLLLLATLLAGQAQAQESPTLRKIQETGIVTVGYRDQSVPFSYLDEKQKPIGYSIDICMAVVEQIRTTLMLDGLEVKLSSLTSANRMPLIANGIVDLDCGTTTNNEERRKKVAFSVTTFVTAIHVAVKRNSNVHSVEDLRGRTVATTAGATSAAKLAQLNRERDLHMHVVFGKDHAESFQILETDRADAFIMDDALLYGQVASSANPQAYQILPEALSTEYYGIMLRRDDPEFKAVVDAAIVKLYRNGEIDRLYRKWFLSPIAPYQVNLRMPMSEELKKLILQARTINEIHQ